MKFKRLVCILATAIIFFGCLNLTNFSSASESYGIPFAHEIKGEYTVNAQGYKWVLVKEDYKDLKKGTSFFLNSEGEVVVDETLIQKLILVSSLGGVDSLKILRNSAVSINEIAKQYYEVHIDILTNEKVGTIVGSSTGMLLRVIPLSAPSPVVDDCVIDIFKAGLKMVKDMADVKAALLNGILLIATLDAMSTAEYVYNYTAGTVTSYETYANIIKAYSSCYANFNTVIDLVGDEIREQGNSNILKEIGKYFNNVFKSLANSLLIGIEPASYVNDVFSDVINFGEVYVAMELLGKFNSYKKQVTDKWLNRSFNADYQNAKIVSQYLTPATEKDETSTEESVKKVNFEQFNAKYKQFKSKKYLNGSTYVDNPSLTGGYQCFGFANEIAKYIFGSYPTTSMSAKTVKKGWTVTYGANAVDNLKIGDIVRYGYHSIFITGISGDKIYYCQANVPSGTNKVTYDNVTTKSSLKSKVAKKLTSANTTKSGWVAHYNGSAVENEYRLTVNYNANGGTVPTATAVGETYKVTASVGLNVRATASSSGTKLGAIAVGTAVTVTEKKTASDYVWGKILYKGKEGWIALNSSWVSKVGTLWSQNYYEDGGNIYKKSTSKLHAQTCVYGESVKDGLYNAETLGLIREGYIFKGWSLTPVGGELIDQNAPFKPEELVKDFGGGDKTVTVYAVWEQIIPPVTDFTVEKIYIEAIPNKGEYFVGDIIDGSKISVLVERNNGVIERKTQGFALSPSVIEKEGEQQITVTYEGKSAVFSIFATKQKERANNATALCDSKGYLLPSLSALTLKNQGVWKGDNLQVLCKDGDYYLCLMPWGASVTNKTNGVLLYVKASDISLNAEVSSASEYYSLNPSGVENATVINSTKVYYKPDGGQNPIKYADKVIEPKTLSAGELVKVLFEMDGYYCVQTQTFTGFAKKEDVKLNPTVYKIESNLAEISLFIGEDSALDGIEITAYKTDGTSETTTDFTAVIPDLYSQGEKYATFTHCGLTAFVKISVEEPKTVGLSLESLQTKTVYAVGEKFDFSGMVINAELEDGSVKTVTETAFYDYEFSESGSSLVKISYCGFSITIPVTVYEMPTVEAFNAEGYAGQTVEVPVLYLSEDLSITPTSFSAEISYNADELQFIGVCGVESLDKSKLFVEEKNGVITLLYESEEVILSNGSLLNLQFKTLKLQEDNTPYSKIVFESFIFKDSLGNSFNSRLVNGSAYNLGSLSVAFITEVSGEDFALITTDYNGEVTVPNRIPEKDGYTFVGWSDKKGEGGVVYKGGDTVVCSQNLCLYAVWAKNGDSNTESSFESKNEEVSSLGCNSSVLGGGVARTVLLTLFSLSILRKKTR